MTQIKHTLTILILALASATCFAGTYNSIMDIGDPMPSFENLPGINGNTLSSSDLKGSVVVMVSLANHCPWVKGMDPGLVALATKLKDKNVIIVGFSVNHKEEDRLPAMIEHARNVGYNFEYIYDESQELGRKLGATRTPEYFVFDKQRTLAYTGLLYNSPARLAPNGEIKHINGEPSIFYVEDAVSALLEGKTVEIKETRAHGCGVKYENPGKA